MGEYKEFNIDEYAERIATRSEFAGGLLRQTYDVLCNYEQTVNPDKEFSGAVSAEHVQDYVDEDGLDEALSGLPKQHFAERIFILNRIGSGVSDETDENIQRCKDGYKSVRHYKQQISSVVRDIREYDEDFDIDIPWE